MYSLEPVYIFEVYLCITLVTLQNRWGHFFLSRTIGPSNLINVSNDKQSPGFQEVVSPSTIRKGRIWIWNLLHAMLADPQTFPSAEREWLAQGHLMCFTTDWNTDCTISILIKLIQTGFFLTQIHIVEYLIELFSQL